MYARLYSFLLIVVTVSLAACAGSGGERGPVPDRTLSGRVSYMVRMATPPDSVLEVQLLDLAAPGAGILADATYADPGQPPFDFRLDYAASQRVTDAEPALQATLRDAGGRVLFATRSPVPVDPSSPRPVEVVMEAVPAGAPERAVDATRRTLVYVCPERDVAVTMASDATLLLHLPGRVLRLGRVESASGARYAADEHEFWSQGATARLTLDGGETVECRLRRRDRGE